ncbi:hypothetical protein [Streptomyces sp. NPDC057429]|uniref:hypothetical protein n=1 Tax=Streptomyces sp. NPDC057429 TaxID=3346130 RepID=UPI00368618F1
MITSRLHPLCAVAASAALLLTGCSGGAADDKPAHPVFDVPVGQQPHQALLATQAARSAAFTQTLTFSSPSGDTVQTTSGRLDFPGSRAVGSIDWAPAEKLPQEAQDTLLGTRLAGRAPTRTRLAVDPGTIRLRAGEARYWLLYEGNSGAIAPGAAVDTLRGSEAAFGGTLLEVLSAAEDVKEAPAKKGGRVYRAELSQTYALRLFPKDLGSELAISMDANGDVPFVPLSISVDAKGRVLRAEADLSALLGRKDSALKGMTGLRARLDLTGFGVSAPVMPAASEPALDAKKAVTKVAKVKKGGCADLATGTRTFGMVVSLPCEQPHDIRVFGHARFDATYPGKDAAKRMAGEACDDAHDAAPSAWTRGAVKKGRFTYTWPRAGGWGAGSDPVITCYVKTR